MNKKAIITILFALVAMAGQAKEKTIVWEQPTTEYGNSYGDGFFYLALDVTKVELKRLLRSEIASSRRKFMLTFWQPTGIMMTNSFSPSPR